MVCICVRTHFPCVCFSKKKKNPPKNQLNCHNEIAKSIHSKEIPYMYTHTHKKKKICFTKVCDKFYDKWKHLIFLHSIQCLHFFFFFLRNPSNVYMITHFSPHEHFSYLFIYFIWLLTFMSYKKYQSTMNFEWSLWYAFVLEFIFLSLVCVCF